MITYHQKALDIFSPSKQKLNFVISVIYNTLKGSNECVEESTILKALCHVRETNLI